MSESWLIPGTRASQRSAGIPSLYDFSLKPEARGRLVTVRIRYKEPGTNEMIEDQQSIGTLQVLPTLKDASPSYRLAAAVMQFAEVLRRSEAAQAVSLFDVLKQAELAAVEMDKPADAMEFVNLVNRTLEMMVNACPSPDPIRQNFQYARDEIVEKFHLRDPQKALYGQAVRAWREYLSTAGHPDVRQKVQSQIDALNGRAKDLVHSAMNRAERLDRAEAQALWEQVMIQVEGTDSEADAREQALKYP
ncbi:MAG: DUF3520 domain-containing protein [Planctomycetes bacterium]|nr:DUF3520 domain-containing protein [Planctomycetota bacterium]